METQANSAATQPADPSQLLIQLGLAYVPSAALWVAAELKITDLIGSEARPVADLARSTGTNEDALFRILRLLAMIGIFA